MTERDADLDKLRGAAKPLGEYTEDRAREFLDVTVARAEAIDSLALLCREARDERDAALRQLAVGYEPKVNQLAEMTTAQLRLHALLAEAEILRLRPFETEEAADAKIRADAAEAALRGLVNAMSYAEPLQVVDALKQAHAALAASPQPTEGASVPPDAPGRAVRGETLRSDNIGQDGSILA